MASGKRGASHTRKLAKGRPRDLTGLSADEAIFHHLRWLEQGGARQWDRDFTAAPIAMKYGAPYSTPLTSNDVARGFSKKQAPIEGAEDVQPQGDGSSIP